MPTSMLYSVAHASDSHPWVGTVFAAGQEASGILGSTAFSLEELQWHDRVLASCAALPSSTASVEVPYAFLEEVATLARRYGLVQDMMPVIEAKARVLGGCGRLLLRWLKEPQREQWVRFAPGFMSVVGRIAAVEALEVRVNGCKLLVY